MNDSAVACRARIGIGYSNTVGACIQRGNIVGSGTECARTGPEIGKWPHASRHNGKSRTIRIRTSPVVTGYCDTHRGSIANSFYQSGGTAQCIGCVEIVSTCRQQGDVLGRRGIGSVAIFGPGIGEWSRSVHYREVDGSG